MEAKKVFNNEKYLLYKQALNEQPLPLAFVDLDQFDANIAYVRSIVANSGKTIRVGTKSIRCEALTGRIFELGGNDFKGLLTYTAAETAWLAEKGHDDFIIAYPTVQESDLSLILELTEKGKAVLPMVDCLDHLQILSKAAEVRGIKLGVCLEIDMAFHPFNLSGLHLGVRRSPLRSPEEVIKLVEQAEKCRHVEIKALMGYEGHIAGTADAIPGKTFKNAFMRYLKRSSVRELTARRQAIVSALAGSGLNLEIVNGGGSGSLRSTLQDQSITEITVGSGFFCPGLFHNFAEVNYRPSAFFAIQFVRKPADKMITCLGGGYTASGPVGPEKLPLPAMPVGLQYLSLEGAGEVQTPFILPEDCPELNLGDPIILQHAKGGELCERFDSLLLIKKHSITGSVPTYRGEGKTFL
jgi:D-serine deaminase-like pyridoxal phosphate-dependent protein